MRTGAVGEGEGHRTRGVCTRGCLTRDVRTPSKEHRQRRRGTKQWAQPGKVFAMVVQVRELGLHRHESKVRTNHPARTRHTTADTDRRTPPACTFGRQSLFTNSLSSKSVRMNSGIRFMSLGGISSSSNLDHTRVTFGCGGSSARISYSRSYGCFGSCTGTMSSSNRSAYAASGSSSPASAAVQRTGRTVGRALPPQAGAAPPLRPYLALRKL